MFSTGTTTARLQPSSQRHPWSGTTPEARRWLSALAIKVSAVAAAASQDMTTWARFPAFSGLHLSRFSLRARTRCFSALNYAGWQKIPVGRETRRWLPSCSAPKPGTGLRRGWLPWEPWQKQPLVATSCSQPTSLPLGLALDGKNAQQQGRQQLHEEVWGRRREALGKGAVRSRGWLCTHFPGAGKWGGRQAGLQFCIRKTNRLQQKGIQQAEGQTHTLLCANCQNSGHLQRMRALSVPAPPPAPTTKPPAR